MTFGFAHPWVLLLLLLLPLRAWRARREPVAALTFSRASLLASVAPRHAVLLARLPGWLRTACLGTLIIAIATPRTGAAVVDADTEGIAIAIAIDVSTSMLAEDFAPRNRISVAKQTVAEFVGGREHDRIGLVAFAGEALTQVPITIDYPVIYQALEDLQPAGSLLQDGTAIGTAIATAANRLRRAPGESRVMILMTDGENNAGQIDPITAARAAAAFGIRIYTVGVGSDGVAPIPLGDPSGTGVRYATLRVSIDEELLREVADLTGGQYFRATSESALDSIYGRIDQLERSTVDVQRYVNYEPHYLPLLIIATLALLGEWTLRASRWGRVP